MFCVVTVVVLHVLCCDGGTCTCFVLLQRYVYMFCVVTVIREKKGVKIIDIKSKFK